MDLTSFCCWQIKIFNSVIFDGLNSDDDKSKGYLTHTHTHSLHIKSCNLGVATASPTPTNKICTAYINLNMTTITTFGALPQWVCVVYLCVDL